MKMYDEDEPEKTFQAIDHIQPTISSTMSPLQSWQSFISPKVMNSFLTMLLNLFIKQLSLQRDKDVYYFLR